jgi:ParB family chromosome partitioning protein
MPRKKKSAEPTPVGLSATDALAEPPPPAVKELAAQVARDGGTALASYRDPYGGQWLILASLPLERVQPTPYQRELSATHADRLAAVIPKIGRFLDPVIATRRDGAYLSPNGMHRLAALARLGARAVTALIVPEAEVAYRILALNTEKAHALKDKSLEVFRMAKALAAGPAGDRPEADWAFEFEEPAFLTLGACYEESGRFAGGAYQPVLRRCEEFLARPIAKTIGERARRGEKLLDLDRQVGAIVARLKEAGLHSAYLKPFVVARINPLRQGARPAPGKKAPRAAFDATLDAMRAAADRFDVSRIRPADLAAAAGAPGAEE